MAQLTGMEPKVLVYIDIHITCHVSGLTTNSIGRDVAKFGKELWERLNGKEEEGIDDDIIIDMISTNNYYNNRGHAITIRFTRSSSSQRTSH